jgi:RNA polymerase sigma-70 factor (ECF subfamily)
VAELTATGSKDLGELESRLAEHRSEIRGYCYRMLGSSFEAEDATQETFVRAWKGYDRFEGRSALRSWLYRIATNVCFDMLNGRNRRARPMDLGPVSSGDAPIGTTLPEETWIEPIPDGAVEPVGADPADLAVSRESIRLAFVAALQHLPPRQRAVLILREVLRWKADEVAELLGTSVPSVNSALQRARATLATSDIGSSSSMDEEHEELLGRYVEAFERYDIESLVTLLHDDALHTMPPYPVWLQGPDDIGKFMLGQGAACRGSRLVATSANGCPAFGQYRPAASGEGHDPWSLQVLDIVDGRIAGITYFLDTARMFPLFGLATHLD